ncbi:CPBP family intramembrane glutamic endopeptidase [Lactococcus petauri]|uniref:CPBP family intramembrane glutamic endopeptidase n=1 Tax=Lactococcus petauri TaxID=1940789 RepID=UPI002550F8E2|nr:type II CAAX endopeptidase family protein [Lactococcus petauri]
MKIKYMIMLFAALVSAFLMGALPPITLVVSGNNNLTGYIPIPIFSIVIVLLFLGICDVFFKENWSFDIKNWKNYKIEIIILLIPVIITVVLNIITSDSLKEIFTEMPMGQLSIAVIFSLIGALFVGIVEEVLTRGGILTSITELLPNSKYKVLLSSFISGILFGILHLFNIMNDSQLVYTLFQVAYTSAIGFCFAIVYFITGSLAYTIIAHTLIDWSDFFFNMTGEPNIDYMWYIPVILVLSFLISGILLYRRYIIHFNKEDGETKNSITKRTQ